MFESDDFDQILSQVEFPELCATNSIIQRTNILQEPVLEPETKQVEEKKLETNKLSHVFEDSKSNSNIENDIPKNNILINRNSFSPKHTKRIMINSYFDHKSKRKFPGPAGLLLSNFEEKKDNDVCHLELLSQDIDFSQSYLHCNVFETPLWKRLLEDTASLRDINSIMAIKHQALAGNLQRKKAKFVAAIVESVDRSAIDPLITLRDNTGNIKCTLHRDAWTAFSTYIASEFCALVLCKPTVLTTGSAFKKHYLNITLSNISTIYSSVVVTEGETLPEGYQKICEEDCTIIKINRSESCAQETIQDNLDILDDLDNVFTDDMF